MIITKDLHEVELVSMVDTKLGQSSIWVQTIFTLKRRHIIKFLSKCCGLEKAPPGGNRCTGKQAESCAHTQQNTPLGK